MKILVIGAGAIGGYFGARLLAAGRDVSFLVRERRAAQLAASGLVVRSPKGDLVIARPPTLLAADIRAPYDLVLLSCKAYDLVGAIESFAPAVGPDTMVLPLLNGMAQLDALEARFGRRRVLGGSCAISATLDEAGAVLHLNALQSMSFGEREGGLSARVEAVLGQLGGAGFDAGASADILQDMWEKWVFLATLACATCLMRAPVRAIIAAPQGPALLAGLFEECGAVARAHGHAPRPAFVERIRPVIADPASPIKASMLRDIERGSRIEADHIVGDLIRRRPGAPALALLDIAYCHLKAYEAGLG